MGFTLVELMVVIAIIGVAAGAVVLSMPDPRPTLAVEAERFAARLTLAREEVVMTNRPVALRADAAGYGFESFDGAVWTPLTGVLAPKAWGGGRRRRRARPRRVRPHRRRRRRQRAAGARGPGRHRRHRWRGRGDDP